MDARLTPATAAEICMRSAGGEGVVSVINGMGLPLRETMEWLRREHYSAVMTAKEQQKADATLKKKRGKTR